MKIAVSAYSFYQAITAGRMNILDVIPKAKEMNFDGVEITNVGIPYEALLECAPKLHAQSKEYGLPIVAYLTSADLIANDLDTEVARLKKEVELAATMGAPMMRHDASGGTDAKGNFIPFEQGLPILIEGYRRVTEFAAGLGVHTMIENHGYYSQDSARVKALIEGVNHKNFGWLVDIGNFICADEDSVSAVTVAAPYAVHAHAKDFHYKDGALPKPRSGWFNTRGGNLIRGAMIGHGMIDIPGCIAALRAAGYDKWLSIEFEGMEDCVFAIEEGYANLKSYL